jgi:hypothetical protein
MRIEAEPVYMKTRKDRAVAVFKVMLTDGRIGHVMIKDFMVHTEPGDHEVLLAMARRYVEEFPC